MSRVCACLLPSAAAMLLAMRHVSQDSLCFLLSLFSRSPSSLGSCEAQAELSPARVAQAQNSQAELTQAQMAHADKTQDPFEFVGRPAGWRGTASANKPLKKLKSSNRRYARLSFLAGNECYLTCALHVSLLKVILQTTTSLSMQLKAAKCAGMLLCGKFELDVIGNQVTSHHAHMVLPM